MKKSLVVLTAGILIGGGAVFAWTELRTREAVGEMADALDRRDADLARLKADLNAMGCSFRGLLRPRTGAMA